jgi:YD repeat-containing protein
VITIDNHRPLGGPVWYDLVGNRSMQNRSASAGTTSTTYTYDVADQLTQETSTGDDAGTKTTGTT